MSYHLVFMAATVGAVYFGVKGGIERVARMLMPLLFAIILFLVIYSTTTSGFGDAMRFLFRPNFGDLEPSSILEAVGQAFFSLSLGMGAMLTYGSYMQRKSSIPRSVMEICILDSTMGILACVIMFSIIFTFDLEVTQSATILFTTLAHGPGPTPPGQLGAGSLLRAGGLRRPHLHGEPHGSGFQLRHRRAGLGPAARHPHHGQFHRGVRCVQRPQPGRQSVALVTQPLRQGIHRRRVLISLDYLAANWLLPVGGLLIAVFVGWVLKTRDLRAELEEGHGDLGSFLGLLKVSLRYVAPLAVGAIIFSIIFLGAEYQ